jgi:Protein kinase domain
MDVRTAGMIDGRYRIRGLLGEGGMARVFDAFDERLQRPVAVKILRRETGALPGMRQRFAREARLAARLNHPHIVSVLDFGESDESSFLAMERLPGATLRHELARGPLSSARAMLVIAETLAALEAAHRIGILHRDIKPNNILIQEDGHTKLSDFGIAKSFATPAGLHDAPIADDATMTGVVLGTPGYLAPERRAGRPASVQSDIYAVGAVMVEALTGQRTDPEPVSAVGLPSGLQELAERSLAPDPRQRFASATQMLEALRDAGRRGAARPMPVGSSTVPMPAERPVGRSGAAARAAAAPRPGMARRARVRRQRALLALAAIASVAAALVFLLSGSGHPTPRPALASTHRQATSTSDPVASSIEELAATLSEGGLPGDVALAHALSATAGAPPGAQRRNAAQRALSLGQALLAGGSVSALQYQDVIGALTPTGATPPTTTTTTTLPPVSGQHDHGGGDGGPPGGGGGHAGGGGEQS